MKKFIFGIIACLSLASFAIAAEHPNMGKDEMHQQQAMKLADADNANDPADGKMHEKGHHHRHHHHHHHHHGEG